MASGIQPNSFQGMSADAPTSMVELSITCRNLKDTDVFSKADPMCVFYMQHFGQQKWIEVDRTEQIMNTLNPNFAKKFIVTFHFEQVQKLKFEMYDVDSSSTSLAAHDFLGFAEFSLGETVSMCSITKPLDIGQGKKYGSITVRAEELSGCKEELTFQFMGKNLPKGSFFSSAAPFLTFSRVNEDNSFTVVHRTEHPKSTTPVWKTFTLTAQTLCNGDFDRVIKIECHHYKNNGNSHKYIGEITTNLNELTKDSTLRSPFYLINKEKQKKSDGYKNSGEITLVALQRNPVFTFLDYIQGGTELLCTVAIDFTGSNGDPRKPDSLHFIDQYRPNYYVQALYGVGTIIQDYDSDKLFPVLGFGAKLPPDGRVSHEFFVNMNPTNPYCAGLDGVINAYTACLNQIQLYGPTNFAPVINHVGRIASTQRDGTKYHILLILTDGIITDMMHTKEAIVNASCLPISIIIVGIGNADFAAMEELDGDTVRLQSNGRYAERDIVQFVAYRDFGNALKTADFAVSQAELAKAVLAEVPTQFISYMKKNGVKPGTPKEIPNLPPI
uniref:C2 domain-containing protein n=1 Tax=Strigamia maritima TaxID=126957 RepID=T1JN01_STRMM